jgi:hypothetical protein
MEAACIQSKRICYEAAIQAGAKPTQRSSSDVECIQSDSASIQRRSLRKRKSMQKRKSEQKRKRERKIRERVVSDKESPSRREKEDERRSRAAKCKACPKATIRSEPTPTQSQEEKERKRSRTERATRRETARESTNTHDPDDGMRLDCCEGFSRRLIQL